MKTELELPSRKTLEILQRWANGTPKERQAANMVWQRAMSRKRAAALRARAAQSGGNDEQ